nr:hypothetical protein [Escherichia coli]
MFNGAGIYASGPRLAV